MLGKVQHRPPCHGPGSAAVVMGQHLARSIPLSPLSVQEQALSKSTKGTGFAKHEIISKPCLSHISCCVEQASVKGLLEYCNSGAL